MFKKIREKTGFSIIEVMVVVMIIALLTTLAGNRILGMIARARQAEARTNLSQIYQLQVNYQMHADNYAEWPLSTAGAIGYDGSGTKNCVIETGTSGGIGKTAGKDGAHQLGWKPDGCEEMRYAYGVFVGDNTTTGKEHFFAVAHAMSDTTERIFPTCDGVGGGRTTGSGHSTTAGKSDVTHEDSGASLTFEAGGSGTLGTDTKGDTIAVSDAKMWHHSNIIEACD